MSVLRSSEHAVDIACVGGVVDGFIIVGANVVGIDVVGANDGERVEGELVGSDEGTCVGS